MLWTVERLVVFMMFFVLVGLARVRDQEILIESLSAGDKGEGEGDADRGEVIFKGAVLDNIVRLRWKPAVDILNTSGIRLIFSIAHCLKAAAENCFDAKVQPTLPW